MNNVKAVIFDLDGLLIDSEPYWEEADTKLLSKRNVVYDSETRRQILGMGHREVMNFFKKRYNLKDEVEALMRERMVLLYRFLFKSLHFMEGAKLLIKRLYQRRLALAVATTGHTRRKAERILTKLGMKEYPSLIFGNNAVRRGKPHPDIYLLTAQKLGVDPSSCLVLEDAPNGVVAGKAAGMIVYGVNKDASIRERLKEAGSDKVFTSLGEVKL